MSTSEKDSGSAPEKSNIYPAVPRSVILKLLGFTLAMIVAPIGSYFATVDALFSDSIANWRGNSTYAGALAAIIANVVLIAYIVVAFNEDLAEQASDKESKKTR
ncbi:vacuolar atpase assembly integral membrane protein vma21 [Ophiostoma piceae UAMH 11346]|uniref:Vacuolar atpase assembly integral membrane protein vma21 n=1 Tax=Ophiostoma piceae (strain UAMH 11346) TaxID=1262450 RepID=S3C223_OPHP1|nr:vacuolar atpase assembly integral membrane protein vma21 [Ophiostoma piceae UAMH 11346]